MKSFSLFLLFFLSSLPASLFACDPIGCLFGGHYQDTLILGEVVSVGSNKSKDLLNVKVIYIFPQNKLREIKKDREILVSKVGARNLSDEEEDNISKGQKYLFSLNKSKNIFYSAFGFYEVKGERYSDMQIVKKKKMDDIVLQLFMNSGGVDTSFSVDHTNQEKPELGRSLAPRSLPSKGNKIETLQALICEREIRDDREILTFNRNLKKCQ